MTPKRFLPFFMLSILFTFSCGNTKRATEQILITAPSIYNERLSTMLTEARKTPIPFPIIETLMMENNTEIDSLLMHLNQYDWILFSSRNAIKAFFSQAMKQNIPLEELKKHAYGAIGKDQDYLKTFGDFNLLKSTEASPQGLVEALKAQKCEGQQIAVLAPIVLNMPEPDVVPNFIDSLISAKVKITRINAYTTKACTPCDHKAIIRALKKGKIDLIAFTSTAEIQALQQLIGDSATLAHTPCACFGPYTYNNALKLGLHPAFMAEDYSSFAGYTTAIVDYFNHP